MLIDLAATAEVFHTPTGIAYEDLSVDGHRETWPVRGPGVRAWLRRGYYEATRNVPSAPALNAAVNLLEAQAQFDGPERSVHVRVAEHDGHIYLDLADTTWRAIEIGPDGWRVVAEPPVRFRRPPGLLPLPMPERQGARALLAQAVEAEVADFLAKHADLKTEDGRQRHRTDPGHDLALR
jgi:hypothetical protein